MISWFDIKKSYSVFFKDTRYALVVILSLAFSLGVSLFLFEQIYTIKHKPLEFNDSDRIVSITRFENGWAFPTGGIYYYDFLFYQKHQTSFEVLARYEDRLSSLQTDQVTEWVQGTAVNAELFQITSGVNPVLGRTLVADDNIHGSPQVAVIGYDLWQRLFSGAEDVLGKTFTLNGLVYSIVGVMPKGFNFPINHEVWVSYPMWDMPEASTIGWNTAIGKIKEGVSLEQARSEMKDLAAQLRQDYPDQFKGKDVHVVPYTEAFSNSMTSSLHIMIIVGIAILLMGAFSVSNLLIVRMLENQRESTIKSALGLPAWRIAAKPLLESFWMCAIAGILSVLLCLLFTRIASTFMYSSGPYWWTLTFDSILIYFAIFFVLIMWMATGVVPVIMALRAPTNSALASGKKGGISGKSGPVMNTLISIQVVCAFVLMVLTGLSVEALIRSVSADYGVKIQNVMVADVRLSEFSHPTVEDRVGYYETLEQEIGKIDGVKRTAFVSALAGFGGNAVTYRPSGMTTASESFEKIYNESISENYFDTVDVKLIEGRFFNRFDDGKSTLVGIVDQRTALLIDPAGNVVGKQIQIDLENNGPLITIVGVVSPVLQGSPMVDINSISGTLYRPMRQHLPFWGTMNVVVDVESESPLVADEIKQAGRRVTPQIAVAAIMSFQDRVKQNTRQVLSMVYNFLPAAFLAFLMATLGIYGISTRITLQKANDLGVMKAIGATDMDILKTFLKKTWALLFVSFALGLAVLIVSMPMVISGNFVFTWSTLSAIVALILLLIFGMVTIASIIPVNRINRLSPQAALNFQIGNTLPTRNQE